MPRFLHLQARPGLLAPHRLQTWMEYSMPGVDTELLRKTPLVSLLDDQEIAVLSQHLDERRYLAGRLIFSAGEPGDAMYIVDEGKVELFLEDKAGDRVTLGTVEPGELFGEM